MPEKKLEQSLQHEAQRLAVLEQLEILDTDSEPEFDDLTRLAAQICEVPISLISLIDADRQWFKSKIGLNICETPREQAFCDQTILSTEMLIVPDAAEDERFVRNPLVAGEPHIRFYAGAPLITDDGSAVGTLCVIDFAPRDLREEQKTALQALARQAARLLKLRFDSKALQILNEKLKAREESYRIVSDSASDAIITFDEDGCIIFANAAVKKMFGYLPKELVGQSLELILPEKIRPADSAEILSFTRDATKKVPVKNINLPALRRDGTEIQIEISFCRYFQSNRRLHTGIMRDTTERQISEAKLQASEKRYRSLAEMMPQQVWTANSDGQVHYGNFRIIEYFGKELVNRLIGMEWSKVLHPDDLESTVKCWRHSIETGENYEIEYRLRRADGEYRWHLAQAQAMFDDNRQIVKWLGTNTDIHDRKMAEKVARETAEYRNLFRNANDAIMIFELETEIIIEVNDKACEIYRLQRDELIGKSVRPLSQNPQQNQVQIRQLVKHGTAQSFETTHYRGDGSPINLFINSSIIEYQGRKVVLSINRDITDRKLEQEKLFESQQMLQTVMDTIPNAIFWKDRDLKFLGCNRYMAELLNLNDPSEVVGKDDFQMGLNPVEVESYHRCDRRVLETGEPQYHLIETQTQADGSVKWHDTNKVPLRDLNGRIIGILGTFQDITERKRAEEKLMHNALHDNLTGLPNRALFLEHLRHAIELNGTRGDKKFAVLFLDFDHFKVINDSLGHLEGDNLLCLIARRLSGCLRPGDVVSRLGGDEFTIMLDDLSDSDEVVQIVERIQSSLQSPYHLTGSELHITAGIGIALSDADYGNPENMVRDADIAMYRAKANGKARHQIFNPSMHEQANYRLQLETEMRRGLKNREFCLFYQPIINLKTNRVKGFESLVRWRHPERGLLPPIEFIPIAEETGLIIPLGEWIVRESCRQLRRWQNRRSTDDNLTMSVNLSCKQFVQRDLFERIFEIVRDTKIEPGTMRLEITESHLMEDSEASIEIMNRLKSLDIKLSIDDFGTGYSSLSYLHRLPINYLKIDRSFVSQMQTNSENLEIVRTILTLARNLNLEVIAEGIETREQANYLKSLKCGFGQGFYYSKPVPARNAGALIGKSFADEATEFPVAQIDLEMVNHLTQ